MEIPPDTAAAIVKAGSDAARAAADTPSGRAAGSNLGDGAVVVSRFVRNLFLPLALYNAKREAYFNEKFETELGAKVEIIPEEHRQEPKASIAGPAVEGLGYAYEEDELRERYLNLLAASVDARRAPSLHPAFGEILRQVTADEIGLLAVILGQGSVGIARLRREETGTISGHTVYNHLLPAWHATEGAWVNPDITSWVDNWIRLGLVDVDYGRVLTAENAYDWVEERPEYVAAQAETDPITHDLKFEKGLLSVTAFGRRFAKAVAPPE